MRTFVAVAEEEGFAAAARRLSLSPAAVTRAVSALEDHLGARLLHRNTRVVRVTAAGAQFLVDCKRILGELADAEAAAAGSHAEPAGPLLVTAPVMFGRLFVAPLVFELLDRHPRVEARVLLLDRVVDLLEEGLDVGVRIAHPDPLSSDVAVRVGEVRRVVCASPAFLAAHGAPEAPAEVLRFETIGFSSSAGPIAWSFQSGGEAVSIRPRSRLVVNSTEVAVTAAVAGRGLMTALSYQVAAAVARGELRVVLSSFELPPVPIHVIYREGRLAAARVRAFVELATERLRANRSAMLPE